MDVEIPDFRLFADHRRAFLRHDDRILNECQKLKKETRPMVRLCETVALPVGLSAGRSLAYIITMRQNQQNS